MANSSVTQVDTNIDAMGIFNLYNLAHRSTHQNFTSLLVSIIEKLDPKHTDFVLSLAIICRSSNIKLPYIDNASVQVYLHKKIGPDVNLLNTCFLILGLTGNIDLNQRAVKDKPQTILEYFTANNYTYPDQSLLLTSNTLKVITNRTDIEISEESREKYSILAIRAFSHRTLDQILISAYPPLSTLLLIRLAIQAIRSYNLVAYRRVLMAGAPPLPIFDELIQLLKFESISDNFDDVPSMDCLIQPNRKPLAYWEVAQVIENPTPHGSKEELTLYKSQRSNLRRLGLWPKSDFNHPYQLPKDSKFLLKALSQAGGLHGVPESIFKDFNIRLAEQLLNYLGLPLNFKEFKDPHRIFLTTVMAIISSDPAYAINFFRAVKILSNSETSETSETSKSGSTQIKKASSALKK